MMLQKAEEKAKKKKGGKSVYTLDIKIGSDASNDDNGKNKRLTRMAQDGSYPYKLQIRLDLLAQIHRRFPKFPYFKRNLRLEVLNRIRLYFYARFYKSQ